MRVATTDTVLPLGGGANGEEPVHVPKGCTVTYTAYAMHRRPDLFGVDADEWLPERWDGQTYGWVSPIFPGFMLLRNNFIDGPPFANLWVVHLAIPAVQWRSTQLPRATICADRGPGRPDAVCSAF